MAASLAAIVGVVALSAAALLGPNDQDGFGNPTDPEVPSPAGEQNQGAGPGAPMVTLPDGPQTPTP